jgi:phage gp45-like
MSDRVVKTMKGAPVPEGWSVVKTTRTTQYIQKNQAAPVPKEEFDDLLAAFGKFGISAQVVQASDAAMDTSGGKSRKRGKRSARRRTYRK